MKFSVNLIDECLKGIPLKYIWGAGLTSDTRFDKLKWLSKYVSQIQPNTLYMTDYTILKSYMECRKAEFPAGACFLCVGSPEDEIPELFENFPCILVGQEYDLALIGNKLLDYWDQLREWTQKMDRILYSRGSLQDFFDVSDQYFSSGLLMWDKSFDVQAYSGEAKVDSPVLVEIVKQKYFPKEVIENIIRKNLLDVTVGNDTTRYISSDQTKTGLDLLVRHFCRNGFRLYSIAYFLKNPMHPGERERLENFFDHIITFLDNSEGILEDEYHRSVDIFFRDILSGNISTPKEIEDKAQGFHIDMNKKYLCYVLRLDEYSKTKARYLVNYLTRIMPTEHTFEYNHEVVFIKDVHTYNCVELGRVSSFEHLLKTSKAYCGISSTFEQLIQIPVAYRQSEAAIRLGRLMEKETGCIYFYKNYYYYHMLEIVHHEMDLRMMYNKRLEIVLEDDKKHNSNNFHILEVFLEKNLSVSDTAAELFLHRNSIVYRIKKLEQILHIDFGSSEMVQRLYFSLMCHRYLTALEKKEKSNP
ncbi:MAG: hypothetical protein HFG54_05100 [Lachnospiraceae bacterium]|nr:hypothetical protein [Lachnospiraceae bacterium]